MLQQQPTRIRSDLMVNNSVLIVDDTPVNLKLVRVLLTRQGFDVRTANTAEEALELVQSFRPRLVLADVQLPGMNGLEMTRRIKSDPATRDTIVLALTAFAMKGDEQRAYDAGCHGYITKPIDTRTFPALIRKYMSGADETPNGVPQNGPSDAVLRQAFLAEGMEQSGRLIATLNSSFDHAEALAVAHRWSAIASTLGYAEISQNARKLETLLTQNGQGLPVQAQEMFVLLARSFADGLSAL
jgi:CheY-like chemotaxis protein